MLGTAIPPLELSAIRVVLLDIEGTTTPIEFVHQVLFPYARARVHEYLARHGRDPDVQRDIALLRAEHDAESERGVPAWDAETYFYWLMDRDRKSTGLKSLQGKIWEAGYRAGELKGKGEIYPDVRPALERWHKEGKQIAIFSSGSIQAQRNLFANTNAGDLSGYLSAYFDTTTGPKRDAESYRRIASRLGVPSPAILFVSDVVAELDAARAAGMRTALATRSGAEPDESLTPHPRVRSFAELA